MAVTSNVFLLLNMARRVRFSIAQPITIVGWYFSSICLICLLSMAAGPLHIGDDQDLVWSQAFYYGLFAAILYFICASLMVVTVWGAHTKHYAKDFQLTNSQRTLMLQTIMYLFYLLMGALVFSTIEDWVYLDGVYWANQTLFTVGYGDFLVSETLSRALLIPYVFIGVITLGLLIGSIRSLILERGRHRLDARMVEKERRKLVRTMTSKGRDGILEPIREPGAPNPAMSTDKPMSEYERRRAEFLLMRRIQKGSTTRRRWVAVATSTSVWLGLWLIGAAIFQQVEYPYQAWTYFDAFYFAFVTLTTLGYGDRTPISPAGKSFYVLWTMMALPTMTIMISNLGDTVVLAIKNLTLDLGSITILPTEKGFVVETKRVLKRVTCGRLFPSAGYSEEEEDDDDIMVIPPGFLGAARRRNNVDNNDDDESSPSQGEGEREQENEDGNANGASTSSSRQKILSGRQDNTRLRVPGAERSRPPMRSTSSGPFSNRARSLSAIRDPKEALPPSPADYHYLLACEIAAVSRDVKRKEPRRYTFSEWAWYLKLIGEDEASPDTHRKARPHVHAARAPGNKGLNSTENGDECDGAAAKQEEHGHHDGHDQGSHTHRHKCRSDAGDTSDGVVREYEGNGEGTAAEGDNHGDLDRFVAEGDKWSWVGSRSPLMGSVEESEWILDKLTQKLMHELAKARQEA